MEITIFLSCCAFFFVIQEPFLSSAQIFNETYVEPEYLENLFAAGKYEEFSKLLQIENVDLVKPTERADSKNPMMHKGLHGGDILLRPWQREEGRQGVNFAAHSDAKWKRYVPYVINKKGYSASQLSTIQKAISKWNSDFPNIPFRPRSRFFDKNYVLFFNGNGCYSNLGKVGGQQSLSLDSNGCMVEGIVLHEMTHSVGITHEHERPDRDNYIRILPENIPTDWLDQYEKSSYADFKILGKYDYYSIMHYGTQAPGTRKPAFVVLDKSVDLSKVGQRAAMTETDKQKIRNLYN